MEPYIVRFYILNGLTKDALRVYEAINGIMILSRATELT